MENFCVVLDEGFGFDKLDEEGLSGSDLGVDGLRFRVLMSDKDWRWIIRDEDSDESRRLRESLSRDDDNLMVLFMIENGVAAFEK